MKKVAYASGLAALVFALFARTAAFSYIGIDDAAYTFRNPFVAGGITTANALEALFNIRHGGIWMPVTYISYMLDATLCKLTSMSIITEMHLVNALLHTVNFILLWKLIGMLFPSPAENSPGSNMHFPKGYAQPQAIMAAIAALIWAIHPLRAEPVAWIAARKELLWTLFTLSGLICWIKGTASRMKPATGYGLSATAFCALACLSKPTAMCFPFLAALVMWFCRCSNRATAKPSPIPHPLSPITCHLPIMLLMAAATGAIAAYSQTHVAGQAASSLFATPLSHRMLNALCAIGYYVRASLLPTGLHIDCRTVASIWPLNADWDLLATAISTAIILPTACFRRPGKDACGSNRRPSSLVFATGWFLISLLPTLGIFGNFGVEAHADRFAYLPSMAFAFLLAAFLRHVRKDGTERTTMACAAAGIILLSAATFLQLGYWKDDATAYRRTLACDPSHPRAMVHVADAKCSRMRDFDGGIALYRKALSLSGTVPKGGLDEFDLKARLAYALSSRGRYEDFQEVKRIGADVLKDLSIDKRGMMLDALGTAYMVDGDFNRAALLFKASIEAPSRFWPKASTIKKLKEVMGDR